MANLRIVELNVSPYITQAGLTYFDIHCPISQGDVPKSTHAPPSPDAERRGIKMLVFGYRDVLADVFVLGRSWAMPSTKRLLHTCNS
ncbi:hypothetical protein FKM82_019286 [Ascaphus truei]